MIFILDVMKHLLIVKYLLFKCKTNINSQENSFQYGIIWNVEIIITSFFVSLLMNLLFIVGLVLVTISLTQVYNNQQQQPSVIYRYAPRKYLDEQYNSIPLKTTFHNIFGTSNLWIIIFNIFKIKIDNFILCWLLN